MRTSKKRAEVDRRWLEGYIPDPTTYLNQERWDDVIEPTLPKEQTKVIPTSGNALVQYARSVGISAKPGESFDELYRRVMNHDRSA